MRAIVFVLRGCPAGWLGAYGNEWIGTPHLDRLAAESVVFNRHISDCPEPNAASRAWIGASTPAGSELTDALRSKGIRSILVRANHFDTDAPDWFYAGWDEVFDARPQEDDESPLDFLLQSFPILLDRLVGIPQFLLWIEIDRLLPPWVIRQGVFEAYLGEEEEETSQETTDESDADDEVQEAEEPEAIPPEEPVAPWTDPPIGPFNANDPDAREWLHMSFAAVVTSLDAELGALFDQLRERGLDSSALWLLTSDFGFPLGEHGQIGLYRPWLHEELVHLPLVVRLPGATEACRRVPEITQTSDIPAALLEYFGVNGLAETHAASWLALARGESTTIRDHAISFLEVGPAAEQAIRTNDWAYLLPIRVPDGEKRDPQLFLKPDDLREVNDLRMQNLDRIEELEAKLSVPR